ncbi:hypothetical protein SAMN05660874_05671 [Saccharopolyspora flava]|uniref:Uncharacterized protein n=1 Tax=Saccharopolyspora flava TaxID=95161 RepID=A0A1I6V7B6_9PSEU|nr:hypothetical protein SAMN05660874_05671 [Saccharopolyspora flava]
MADGFRVDLDALTGASDGVRATVEAMARKKVADIDCPADAFGHDRLSGVVREFCDRWDVGVANLSDDGAEIASRLSHSVEVYRRTDEAARAHLHGLLVRPNDIRSPDTAACSTWKPG